MQSHLDDISESLQQIKPVLKAKADVVSRNGIKPKYYSQIEPEIIYI